MVNDWTVRLAPSSTSVALAKRLPRISVPLVVSRVLSALMTGRSFTDRTTMLSVALEVSTLSVAT